MDKYGRLLRYVDLPDGTDTGLAQIAGGFAIARYDSRDGYGHPAVSAAPVDAGDAGLAHQPLHPLAATLTDWVIRGSGDSRRRCAA